MTGGREEVRNGVGSMRPAASSLGVPRASDSRPMSANGAGSLKRKAENSNVGPPPKVARAGDIGSPAKTVPPDLTRAVSGNGVTAAISTLGISKPASRFQLTGSNGKPHASPAPRTSAGPASATTTSAVAAPKPALKGYAAILAKAKESEALLKASGSTLIVHKPTERITKRERDRMKVDAIEKQRTDRLGARNRSTAVQEGRSRSSTPNVGKPGERLKKGPAPVAYQGTMRKGPVPLAYQGTMRTAPPGQPAKPAKPKDKYGGQGKYGGYASWSDIDDAEDEDEGDYDSESDMEARMDEIDEEEELATKVARKEDQEALAEETRLKKEKLARQQKLMALSKNARDKKKF
nr:hypothetical protein B0A51_05504 [Rachicladosporium sp. CCFEE 5018]